MNRPALMVFLGVLELVALAYFALVIWRAETLAAILMRGGYAARGWTLPRLASRLRVLGVVGAVVAVAAVVIAVTKVVG
jgi:hypothetical protein